MRTDRSYKNLTWVDLTSPTDKEIRELIDNHEVHPRIGHELLSPTTKPKLDVYDKSVYLILHFPAIQYTHSNERNQEVDFVITKDMLITVHYDTVDSINTFAKEFEVVQTLEVNAGEKDLHAGFIFYHLIRKLYDSIQRELDITDGKLGTFEDKVFSGREREMVEALSGVSRNLLDMEQSIEGHERSLKDLLNEGQKIFGNSFTRELQDILHDHHTVYHRVKDQREFLNDLRTTNDGLLSAKQNDVMQTLTILAFVTFPLSLIASIFGMNTSLPIVGSRGDFWIIIGIMVALTALMFLYFKHNRWL